MTKADTAVIHFETQRANKTRWVKQAQREGMKLSDWITRTLNEASQPMQKKATVQIPDTVKFSDLNLQRDADGHVSFDWAPIEAICEASGLDQEHLKEGPEDNVSGLIIQWYIAHRQDGGTKDATAEDLIAEVEVEEAFGQQFSHRPGRA